MNLILLAAILLTLPAIALLALGVRGRRVGDHPHCRKCGYDLHGRPESSTVCPECGADLARRRATVMGERFRRRRMIVAGGLVLLLAIGPGWVGVVSLNRTINWYEYAPAWLLIRQAFAARPSADALQVLLKRRDDGKLSAQQINATADAILAVQADLARTWDPAWGRIVEDLAAAGALSGDRWERYVKQTASPTLHSRTRINFNDPLIINLTLPQDLRLGRIDVSVSASYRNVQVDGKPVSRDEVLNSYSGNRWYESSDPLPAGIGSVLGAGEHLLTVDVTSKWVVNRGPVGASVAGQVQATYTVSRKFTVSPQNQDQPLTFVDPALRAKAQGSLQMRAFRKSDGISITGAATGITSPELLHTINIRAGGRLYEGGHFDTRRPWGGRAQGVWQEDFTLPGVASLTHVDVILKPYGKGIAELPFDTPIWGEEILYKDVKLETLP